MRLSGTLCDCVPGGYLSSKRLGLRVSFSTDSWNLPFGNDGNHPAASNSVGQLAPAHHRQASVQAQGRHFHPLHTPGQRSRHGNWRRTFTSCRLHNSLGFCPGQFMYSEALQTPRRNITYYWWWIFTKCIISRRDRRRLLFYFKKYIFKKGQ